MNDYKNIHIDENVLIALKYYIPTKYWNLNNWKTIIHRREEIEENIFRFRCSFYELYFNKYLEPVEYGNQHIIDGKVYYDNNKSNIGAGTYTLLGDVKWYKQSDWGY